MTTGFIALHTLSESRHNGQRECHLSPAINNAHERGTKRWQRRLDGKVCAIGSHHRAIDKCYAARLLVRVLIHAHCDGHRDGRCTWVSECEAQASWKSARKGTVLATMAVDTQGLGSVSATKAVETHEAKAAPSS